MQLTYFAVSKTFPALKDAEYSFIRRGSGGGGGYLEWFKIIPKLNARYQQSTI